ncbi:lactonase family protein [Rouxiella badensis]|jgi:6-phosphogluconolactonase|uniref:lactonase family protein n=1 Tax=Rouxiella badensis TaxID=1646377 RepID=UPI000376CC51|nr:lactonase family protein [Rouxiella badensis]MCC3732827.1 lactonase family protein [Rouxiella badensis]MCC3757727.1 lactonase family protein [Rouxiella badensis]QII39801.1 lactonase family protein [Rouxiella badensis]QOI57422.1 lactonase family protein [Rouxiella badensis subsp. acadiensis]
MRNWLRISGLTSALLAVSAVPLYAAEKAMTHETSHYAYVGTYNPNGEGVYRFKVDEKSGALSDRVLVSQFPNQAQMVVGKAGKTLYVGSEVDNYNGGKHGAIAAYHINPEDGSLSLINQVDSQGAGPVYLSLTPAGDRLLVANYISGIVAVFPIDGSGKLGEASSVHQDSGPAGAGKPAAAAEGSFAISDHNGPHAHMIATDPSGKFVFSTDLGLDRIYQWKLNPSNGQLEANTPPFINASSPGAGPRHFVFHPNGSLAFLINEEASVLTSYRVDKATGTLSELHSLSTLPPNFKGTNFAAGIVLSHDGKHLYVANRLHNSIAQIDVTGSGEMHWVGEVWTRGDYPRTLTLSVDGKFVYAMNQRSDNITRFKVETGSGKLIFVDDYTAVGSPSQMVMVP